MEARRAAAALSCGFAFATSCRFARSGRCDATRAAPHSAGTGRVPWTSPLVGACDVRHIAVDTPSSCTGRGPCHLQWLIQMLS